MFTGTWQCVLDEEPNESNAYRQYTCACALIDKVYICGGFLFGYSQGHWRFDTVRIFDTIDNSFKKIAKMNFEKTQAACSAYRGKVVVSGGISINNQHLSFVEAYDHIEDE